MSSQQNVISIYISDTPAAFYLLIFMSPANTLISNQGDRLLAASGGGDGATARVTVSSRAAMDPKVLEYFEITIKTLLNGQ